MVTTIETRYHMQYISNNLLKQIMESPIQCFECYVINSITAYKKEVHISIFDKSTKNYRTISISMITSVNERIMINEEMELKLINRTKRSAERLYNKRIVELI